MKIGLLFLLLFVSTTYSFQCDSLFYGRRCGEYDRASKSLKKIVEKTDDAIDDVYNFLGTESAKLYSTIFEKLGNNVTVIVKGNMTKEEAMALVDKMIKLLKEMTLIGNAAKKDLDKIQQLINEALKGAIGGYGNAYLLLDKLDLEELKNFVSNSLSGMNSIVRTLIVKAIERAHGRLESLGSLIEPIANTFGLTEQYKKIKDKIHELAERAKNRVGGSTYKIEQQIDEAKKDVSSFIDSFKQGAIVKRGISDLWQKVEEALDKLGDNVKKSAKELVEKYKPKILSALGKVKKIILNGTRSLILELKGDIIDILTEDKKEKRSVYGLWDKVKDAVKNLAGNIQDGVNKILEANKPVIEKALGEVKKVVIDGAKKVVIEINNNIVRILTGDKAEKASTHYSPYVIIDQSKKSSLYGFGDVWNKLKAKVQSLGDKIKAKTKVLIEKYKPKILKTIQEVKQFVIDEGQKIIIELKGDLIQIIIKEAITEAISGTTPPAADETEKDVAKRSLSDTWNKIKAAAKRLRTDIKDRVSKIITDFKPKIVEALQNVGKVVIEGAKKVIIEVNNGIVSILTDGQTATSDGSLYHINHVQHSVYVTLDDSTPATYGLTDIWSKVKQTVGILKYKLSAKAKQLIEKYKFEILKSLNKVKEVVIDEGRKLIIKITGDLVEIIEITTDEIKKGITKRSITDYWTKIKEAAKKLGSDIKDKVSKVINEHKSKVLDALDTVKKVVIDGAKKVVIEVNNGIVSILTDGQTATSDGSFYAFDDVKHSAYVVIDNSSPSTYAFSDIWAKVKTTVTGLKDKLSARAKELIEKYKVIITNSLNKVKEFVIDEGKKIVIKIKGDIVEIIESTTDEIKSGITKRSITDYWTKIKEAAKKLGSDIKDKVSKVITEHKSKVLDALNTVKKVVIDGAKKVVIEVNNGIVSILTDGQTATSDGSFYAFDDAKHSVYVVIDNSSPSTYAFSDIWAKVKNTVSILKDKLSAKAKELIEKYKLVIKDSLNRVKEVVIDEGKKLIIKIKGDVVEIIESTTDEIKSGVTKRSITDYWNKIKEAAKKLGSDIKDKVTKVITEHKSKVLDALNTVKKVVIDGAKKVVIEVNNGIVSILTDGQTATSDGSFYDFSAYHDIYVVIDDSRASLYGITDVWEKVKTAVGDLKSDIKDRVMGVIQTYKPKVIAALNNFQTVVIDGAKKIVIEINGHIVKVITEGLEGLSS